mmetsp:Transcript_7436/g.27123  ORF Transcript_7436/g.27123 Transcript_7436/m.27123 type:complete len:261 (+) Transcript_7436:873-1655(+)
MISISSRAFVQLMFYKRGTASRSNKLEPTMEHLRICPASNGGKPLLLSSVMKTIGSISGASSVVRPTYDCMSSSQPSINTSNSCPTRDIAKSSLISCCCDTSWSRRIARMSSGTWSGYSAAGVPSSSLYANAPRRWNLKSRQNCMSSSCSSSVSPGKPLMNVVRSAKPGMLSRNLYNKSSVCCLGGRFMRSKDRFVMCCSGMSMYFATCGISAIALMSSSEKYDGYAYKIRIHSMPSTSASASKSSANPRPSLARKSIPH